MKAGHKSLLKMDRSATCLFGKLACVENQPALDEATLLLANSTFLFSFFRHLTGIRNYGVHINGYVRDPQRGLCIWLQQRSDTKQTWPGKWDNMVGGGLSVGYGIKETAVKEAAEEASIPSDLVRHIVSAGCVSFFFESERGIFPNTEFVYDLELPVDFTPTNADGEVQAFDLLPAMECIEKVFSADFKTTSCPVVIDFLIRHGVITPENGGWAGSFSAQELLSLNFSIFSFRSTRNQFHRGHGIASCSVANGLRCSIDHTSKQSHWH